MLKVTGPNWDELKDGYGPASDLPILLEKLFNDVRPTASATDEPWFTLWSKLCYQGNVYTASYAAVPYLADIMLGHEDVNSVNMNFFLLPASIEIARAKGRGPSVPKALETSYKAAIRRLGDYAPRYHGAKDLNVERSAQAMGLVANGQIDEADTLLNSWE